MCDLQKSELKGPCKRNVTELTMASFVGSVSNQSELTGLVWLFVESPSSLLWGGEDGCTLRNSTSRNPLSAMRHEVGPAGFPQIWF